MTTREELLRRLWGCINRHVIPYYVGRVLVREDEGGMVLRSGQIASRGTFCGCGCGDRQILAAGERDVTSAWFLRYAAYRGISDALSTRLTPGGRRLQGRGWPL